MALWQYHFFVLPKGSMDEDISRLQIPIGEEFFDDSPFWIFQNIKCSAFQEIKEILSEGKSWHQNLIVFGDIETNCVQILCEDEKVSSFSVRIDFRTNYEKVLNSLIDFFVATDLVLIDENLNVLTMNSLQIMHVINQSDQFKKYQLLRDE